MAILAALATVGAGPEPSIQVLLHSIEKVFADLGGG
jgi:hypothetical protein